MRGLFGTTLLVGGLCLLAACGQGGGNGASASNGAAGGGQASAGGGTTTAPTAGGGDQTIDFSALPRPRAGIWRVTEDDGDGHPTTEMHCYSGKVPVVKKPPNCSSFTVKRTLTGGYVMDMACGDARMTMTSHAEMSGDFQTHASGDMTMTMTPAGQTPRTIKVHNDMSWVSDCAPGQTPDDAEDTNAAG